MTNAKSTKRALLTSVMALILCFTMLLGTTFAWFTDSVSSNGNVIQSGTLDVQLFQHFGNGNPVEITDSSDPIFGKDISTSANANSADTLWEPGKTQTVYLSIKNNGSLDLKYMVVLEVTHIEKNLNEVLSYYITPDAQYGEVTKDSLATATNNWALGKRVNDGINSTDSNDVHLKSGEEHFFALSVHMDELAGNNYQDGNVTMNIKVLATQLASENDSFDNQYDADANYPNGYAVADVIPGEAVMLTVYDNEDSKIGTVLVPAGAIADGVDKINAVINESDYIPSITINTGRTSETINIDVSGLKADNTEPVMVEYYIGEGFDPYTVEVYHYDTKLTEGFFSYNQADGYVTIKSTNFSPFTLVYDENSHYENEANLPEGLPTASVTRVSQYENTNLEWGSYGQWSPTEGLDSQLEAAYTFACTETPEQAKLNKYSQWHCDFVVKLDRDLGENQIFLGGNYGTWGWIGFHNGDLTLAANEEVPLLGSVTSNPWMYEDVVDFVGTFTCGVGDVDDALKGATFTVMLRLTNPENENEFYNVATINYTFS